MLTQLMKIKQTVTNCQIIMGKLTVDSEGEGEMVFSASR